MNRTLALGRFLRAHGRPDDAPVDVRTVTYRRGDEELPADLYLPRGRKGRLPAFVVLHGLTCTARAHPSLRGFATAVAASGFAVLVPEIPEWRALHVEPAVTMQTIRAAVRALHDRPEADPDRTGLIGFSFGATQAMGAAADPEVAGLLRGLVAWGGYVDLPRVFRFGLTGQHEFEGRTYHEDPDPYGRWIMVGNYLTKVDGYEDCEPVATALHDLARFAGAKLIPSWDPALDPKKLELRATLPREHHGLFDRLAPPAANPGVDNPENQALGEAVSAAALRADPLLDPQPMLGRLTVPTLIAHGRDDRLIPFTESLRLAAALPDGVVRDVSITALFSHSGGAAPHLGLRGRARETVRFLALLRRLIGMV